MAKKVLVTIDLEHQSSWQIALPEAQAQARYRGCDLVALTVVPDLNAGVDWRYAIRGSTGGSEAYDSRKLIQAASEQLKKLLQDNAETAVAIQTYARMGTIYREIVATADEIQPELIVMNAGRPSLREYLLGSNAAHVVRHANCSVLIAR